MAVNLIEIKSWVSKENHPFLPPPHITTYLWLLPSLGSPHVYIPCSVPSMLYWILRCLQIHVDHRVWNVKKQRRFTQRSSCTKCPLSLVSVTVQKMIYLNWMDASLNFWFVCPFLVWTENVLIMLILLWKLPTLSCSLVWRGKIPIFACRLWSGFLLGMFISSSSTLFQFGGIATPK